MANVNDRIKYLESMLPNTVDLKEKKVTPDEKYWENFEKYSTYMGNGVYQWKGILSPDTSVLYLMGILRNEKIKFKEE